MEMPEGFSLTSIVRRENPCDAFVSNRYDGIDALPAGAEPVPPVYGGRPFCAPVTRISGSSPCAATLTPACANFYEGQFDAIILAAAGLIRLGLKERIKAVLSPEQSLPAPGQGALGIEVLSDRADAIAAVAPLDDAETAHCVRAERAFSRALGGSCQVPLGGYAVLENGVLRLRGFVGTPDGKQMVRAN